jgi:hypothetical protein
MLLVIVSLIIVEVEVKIEAMGFNEMKKRKNDFLVIFSVNFWANEKE